MKHLIDKDALIAEIERLEKTNQEYKKTWKWKFKWFYRTIIGRLEVLEGLKNYINSLEVKDANLENSMVCEVDWYDGFLLDYTQEQQDELLEKIGANVGDKIRVILIKE